MKNIKWYKSNEIKHGAHMQEICYLADFFYNESNNKNERLTAYKKMKYLSKKYKISLKHSVIK
jgi:hypothetical protein